MHKYTMVFLKQHMMFLNNKIINNKYVYIAKN